MFPQRSSTWPKSQLRADKALYVELWGDADARKKRKAKSASKTRYTCPSCGLHAWAKPGARLMCGECEILMEAPESEGEGEDQEEAA